ncbi:MAG: hypothetical protein KAV01_02970 [Candidatus Lokiarchaeota archaeon]|nr:hypothetical protein [Candidatus Lokiarchaeota archaeon]MCK4479466.1 hypothetical protein [Candidatus Lokiarchaeota archaeon]
MKKTTFRIVISILIINIIVISLFFVSKGYCETEEIDSGFGDAPVINGFIDLSSQEWNKATKVPIDLGDLPISLWVMQDDSNLYIAVQFELVIAVHKDTEFFGLIISNSSSIEPEEFLDAKIIQFSNKSTNDFDYLDYNINNSVFLNDTDYNGNGAATIEGKDSTYEFSIPIKDGVGGEEDVLLDFGNSYAFNLTYGDMPIYPSGIKKSSIILINIKSYTASESPLGNIAPLVLCIVVFSILGILYGYYIYKIFRLKDNIERIKR